MEINNFNHIASYLKFEPEWFYFIQVIKRRKDQNGAMNADSRVIKLYFVDSINSYDFYKKEIIELCNTFNARAYIHMTPRSMKAITGYCAKELVNSMIEGNYKRFKNVVGTACGDTFISKQKTFLVDIDTKDIKVIQKIRNFIENSCKPFMESENKVITTIPTLNGVHLICKPFDISDFKKQYPLIDIHKNNPTVLYFNKKD